MKKKLLYAVMICSALATTSCNDFLENDPADGYSVEKVFSNETDMKSLLTELYSLMTTDGLYGSTLVYGLNTNTDVEMSTYSSEIADAKGGDIGCFDAKPTWGTLNSTWNNLYNAINIANDFIANCEKSPVFSAQVAESGPTAAQQMYGEVKTLRAMFYLDLIRTWGDVVYTTTPTTTEDDFFHTGTTDRNEILTALINDLKSVEPMMKYASQIDEGVERASREYCQALIGQLALYRGGYALYPQQGTTQGVMKRADDYLTYYTTAVEYLGKVVNGGTHALKQSYHDLWYNECNWKVADDDDVIFEVPELKNVTSQLGYRIGVTIESGTHSYGEAKNYLNFAGTYPFSFDRRDLRRDETVSFLKYDKNLDQQIDFSYKNINGFGAAKWSKMKMESPLGSNSGGGTGINSIRMRYADVLLMYAEALNEVNNGPTAEAKAALKQVRNRAFAAADRPEMVEAYVDNLGDKESFFKAIMDERKWEFGGEGIRKYDLARWNKYGEVIYNLYHEFANWAKAAQGQYVVGLDSVPAHIYYTWETNAAGRKELMFSGIDAYGDGVSQPKGWKTEDFAAGWLVLDKETGEWELSSQIQWSFRGFITPGTEGSVTATSPVRYLCPYPSKVITDHRGLIKNNYGY